MDEKDESQKNPDFFDQDPQKEIVAPDIEIPLIRTFKQDVSETVAKDKVTTTKILMTEQRKKDIEAGQKQQDKRRTGTSVISLFFGILFLISAIGVFGYFGYVRIGSVFVDPVLPQDQNFLFIFDSEKYIDSRMSFEQIDQMLTEYRREISQHAERTYTEIIFVKQGESSQDLQRINTIELFRLFNVPVITNVARAMSSEFVYGMYTTQGRAEPFLVIGLIDYESAYANTLFWESTLALDIRNMFPVLKDLFDISNLRIENLVTQEESEESEEDLVLKDEEGILDIFNDDEEIDDSLVDDLLNELLEQYGEVEEEQITREIINRGIRFVDVVLANQNTRAVRNENGTPFFYYAFIDRNKILFAQDPIIVGDLIRKIRQRQLVR